MKVKKIKLQDGTNAVAWTEAGGIGIGDGQYTFLISLEGVKAIAELIGVDDRLERKVAHGCTDATCSECDV